MGRFLRDIAGLLGIIYRIRRIRGIMDRCRWGWCVGRWWGGLSRVRGGSGMGWRWWRRVGDCIYQCVSYRCWVVDILEKYLIFYSDRWDMLYIHLTVRRTIFIYYTSSTPSHSPFTRTYMTFHPSIPFLCITSFVPSSHWPLHINAPIVFSFIFVWKLLRLNPLRSIFPARVAGSIRTLSGCWNTNIAYRWYGAPFCTCGAKYGTISSLGFAPVPNAWVCVGEMRTLDWIQCRW